MSNWKLLTLRDICQATQGVQIPKSLQSNTQKKGYQRYYYISDFTHDKKLKYVEDKYPKKKFTSKDLIVSNTGSHGEIFRGKEGILSNNLFKVTFDMNVLDDNFLIYFLKSNLFKNFQSKRVRGTANPHMGHKNFLDTPINLPPINEQKLIAEKLDIIFFEIEKLINLNINYEKQIKSFYANFKIRIFENIINFEEKKLKEVCEKITDGTHQTPKYFENGYIFLSSRNVKSKKIDWEKIKYIDEKQHNEMQKRVSPRRGDILLAKNGTTGVGAIIDRDISFDIYVSLALLRSKGDVLPEYLLEFINSKSAKEQFDKRTKGIGVPNLHLQEIREVVIKYPKSKDEQNKIIKNINILNEHFDKLLFISKKKLNNFLMLKSNAIKKELQNKMV
jgi:type I restriction enzyme, S subunit